MNDDNVLSVRDLRVGFAVERGRITAVDGISFDVKRGSILGIVGESGSGKSVTGQAILQILPANARVESGQILLRRATGQTVNLLDLPPRSRAMTRLRGSAVAMIFQEPMAALSPVHTIGDQLVETIRLHGNLSPRQARRRAIDLLDQVRIPEPHRRIDQHAFEFSGGMRQRIMIAIALAGEPELLIADEPTTALDVTTQAQILELLKSIQRQTGMTVILISHNLGVIAQLADHVQIMYFGAIAERGRTAEIFDRPGHPYTTALLDTVLGQQSGMARLPIIPGRIPPPHERPAGCNFQGRCARFVPGLCDVRRPPLAALSTTQSAACLRLEDVREEAGPLGPPLDLPDRRVGLV